MPGFRVDSYFTVYSSYIACSLLIYCFRASSSWIFLCSARLIYACSKRHFLSSSFFSSFYCFSRAFSNCNFFSADLLLSIFSFKWSAFSIVSDSITSISSTSRKKGGKSGFGAALQSSLTVTLSCDYRMRSVSVSFTLIDSLPCRLVWVERPEEGY